MYHRYILFNAVVSFHFETPPVGPERAANAVLGQRIDERSRIPLVPVRADMIRTQRVDRDEDDVRARLRQGRRVRGAGQRHSARGPLTPDGSAEQYGGSKTASGVRVEL